MTGKQELQEQIKRLDLLAEANICRMSDISMRGLAAAIKVLIGSEFTNHYTREDVARYYNVSTRTLERWQANYPDFPKPRHRCQKIVSYDCEEVVTWKKNHAFLFN